MTVWTSPPGRTGLAARAAAIAAAAAAGAAAVILVMAPASWIAVGVQAASRGTITLGEPSGTAWNGNASVILGTGDGDASARTSLPGAVFWQINPWALLTGTLRITFRDPSLLAMPLAVRVGALGGEVDADRIRLPASVLTGIGAPWNTIRPGGTLDLDWDTLRWRSAGAAAELRGQIRLTWDDASSTLTPVRPFGRYRLQIDGLYPGAQVRLATLSGPLLLSGSGTITTGGHVHFRGTARIRPGTDATVAAQLSGLVSLLGRRDRDGAILDLAI